VAPRNQLLSHLELIENFHVEKNNVQKLSKLFIYEELIPKLISEN
jgi:hypothetical protein